VLILSIGPDMSVFFVFRIVFLMQMLSLFQIFDFGWKLVSLFIKAFFQISAIIFLTFTFLTLFSILGTNLWYDSMDKRCRLTEFPLKHLLNIDGEDVWPISKKDTFFCLSTSECSKGTFCGSSYDYPEYYRNRDDLMHDSL
jgi:hypothetical protein